MQDNKNIRPKNDKSQAHGYWEVYWNNNNLWFKRYFVNGKLFGFQYYQNYNIITELTYYAR